MASGRTDLSEILDGVLKIVHGRRMHRMGSEHGKEISYEAD
jgi:hypothetical protein